MITVVKDFQKISPAFNPVEVQVKSDAQTAPDFRYIVRVYDTDNKLLSTIKKYGGTSVDDVTTFDVGGIVRRSHSFNAWRRDIVDGQFVYNDPGFKKQFTVYIVEYYSGAEQYTVSISGRYTIPAGLHSIKFPSYDYAALSASGRWLTNFESYRVRSADKVTLSYLCPVGGVPSWSFDFYNADGINIATSTTSPLPYVQEDVIHIHAGLSDLVASLALSSDVMDQTSTYTITPANGVGMTFKVIAEDCRFPGVRLHYLNEWGAVDSFVLNLAARRGATIEKKKAKLALPGTPLRPSIYGVGTSPYVVRYTDSLKLTSDYITDNDSTALLELFTSPIVSVEVEQSLFFPAPKGTKIVLPCDIDLTNYDIKQSAIDRLFNLEVEVKISVDNTRQSL